MLNIIAKPCNMLVKYKYVINLTCKLTSVCFNRLTKQIPLKVTDMLLCRGEVMFCSY